MDITRRFRDAIEICRKTAEQKTAAERKRYEREMAEKATDGKKVRVQDGNPLTENIEKLAREKVRKDMQREIGDRLFQIRRKYGLTQKEMVAQCSVLNLTKPALSRWENGERFPDWLFLFWINSEFGENLHWILTGEQEESLTNIATDLEEIVKRLRQY